MVGFYCFWVMGVEVVIKLNLLKVIIVRFQDFELEYMLIIVLLNVAKGWICLYWMLKEFEGVESSCFY